jgi:glycosyltransferase involved in cell wall biosynthesis
VRVAIANFSAPRPGGLDYRAAWARYRPPPPPVPRQRLDEQPHDWGFHIYALGVYLLDRGLAEQVEFWDYADQRGVSYHSNGVLRVLFHNEQDVIAYLEAFGAPDLFVNHGREGQPVLRMLEGRCFRVYVPALRPNPWRRTNEDAECFLVDSEEYLDARSMLYVPVVNTWRVRPSDAPKQRDFIYLASVYQGKRHDILLNAVRGTALTGHLHPVERSSLDLRGTRITTSAWDERDVVELLQTSRIAVYPGDTTSSPAAMWECVAAGLPIVVNREIAGGKHLVVPGVTGELASPRRFRAAMEHVLRHREQYRPREHFEAHWDTVRTTEQYLAFFARMGWSAPLPADVAESGPARFSPPPERPLKIGFLNLLYAKPAERGGLGAHIATLSRELARRGHDVTVLTSGTGAPSVEDGVRVVHLGRLERFERLAQVTSPPYLLRRLAYMARAAEYIRRAGFDVVEAADGGLEHLFALVRRPCPLVMKLHGSFRHIHRAPGGLTSAMHALEGLALRRSNLLYTSSSRYAATVAGDHGLPAERIRVIPYGIDLRLLDAAQRSPLPGRLAGLGGRRLVLLSVGTSPGRKGAGVFVEAARLRADADALFVLICSNRAFLEGVALPANLVVLDHLDPADFYALLAAAEVVVLPSAFESFSIATYEAMLLGRTVVLSRHVPLDGPAREYPRRVTLECLDAHALAAAVGQALHATPAIPKLDPELRARLRAAYGIEEVAEQTLALYREAIERHRQRSAR